MWAEAGKSEWNLYFRENSSRACEQRDSVALFSTAGWKWNESCISTMTMMVRKVDLEQIDKLSFSAVSSHRRTRTNHIAYRERGHRGNYRHL